MTIFTSLKSGRGRVEEIQRSALANWRALGLEVVTLDGPVEFESVARRAAESDASVCAWCNADILFGEGLKRVVEWCEAQTEDFLVLGRRTDLLAGGQRELHRPSGMDYFIFRRGMFRDLPPTIMGRAYCDSAILAYCLRRRIRVIDATDVLTVTHQWHDYGHVAGGRGEVFGGAEAQANKRNNGLRDFGPHIADVGLRFGDEGVVVGSSCSVVKRKHIPILRRLGMWGLWNRLTRGGLGFWGIHEYVGKQGCRYLTRSKVEWWSPNSNVQMRFRQVVEAPPGIWTGFDFPCMWYAWRARAKSEWTLFLWDPPSLSHRDRFPPLRWAIDLVFRWFARRCDRLVLNIHPGLLGEIGFGDEVIEAWRRKGKLVLRMQDAFDDLQLPELTDDSDVAFDYDFGVLSNWSVAKGGPLLAEALAHMPGVSCLWIGDPPADGVASVEFAGRLPQADAFARLRRCRVLVAPYLGVRSLKWNYVLKLFEYLQLGRPIIASDNPGNAEVAAKYPGRIKLFKSGDWVDFMATCAEVDHERFYEHFRRLQESVKR